MVYAVQLCTHAVEVRCPPVARRSGVDHPDLDRIVHIPVARK
jgi:hypothetical protein